MGGIRRVAADATARASLDTRSLARLAGALWVGCGGLVVGAGSWVPLGDHGNRAVLLAVGMAALVVGTGVWFAPWDRWRPGATLVLVPVAFAAVAGFNWAADDPWLYDVFFLVSFAWVGLAHRQGTSLASSPLLVLAYVVPLIGRSEDPRGWTSLAYVLPTCVLMGEAAAWVASRLRRAEEARAASEARYAALVSHASDLVVVLDDQGLVTYANPAVVRVLGVEASELEGTPAREIVHPDDLGMVREWFGAVRADDTRDRPALYRVRHRDGGWRWIEGRVADLRDEPAVGGIVVNGRDVNERVRAEEELAHVARHDPLTGLTNRWAFLDELGAALQRNATRRSTLAVLFLDLDGFKVVNDSLGHAVGDAVLVAVASRLSERVGDAGCLSRLGGDEFTVVMEDVGGVAAPARLAEALLETFRDPLVIGGRRHVISASVGISIATAGDVDVAEVLRQADLAMYRAKELGRARYAVFDEALGRRARRRLDVEAELRQAVDGGDLVLHFQPEVEVATGAIVGVEALVRWQHPIRGLVLPGEFIDIAEESDLIVGLGAFVLDAACAAVKAWGGGPQVSVNLSARQLASGGVPALVEAVLAVHGVDPAKLRLELTERILVDPSLASALLELKELGVELAIDDFGTGYSSLSYLERLPVDVIKIDRSFLAPVLAPTDRAPVVEATLALGRSLGLKVVAEGVETEAQAALLAELGCQRAQGFFYGRPVPFDEATPLVAPDRAVASPAQGAARAAAFGS